jgi:hypothetical protein
MSAASNATENLALKWLLTTDSATRPSAWYVALFNNTSGNAAANLEAGTLTDEVSTSGTAYARQSVAFTVTDDQAANSATVTFPTATGSFGTVTHVAIVSSDVEGAGTVYFWGQLTSSKTVSTSDTFQITSGSLTVTLA